MICFKNHYRIRDLWYQIVSFRKQGVVHRIFLMTIFSFILFFQFFKCIFFLLPFSPLTPSLPQQSPHCCLCPWVFFPFSLIPPPPSLPHHLLSSGPLSMNLSLFCLLVQFLCYIPYMSEIIWHLSCSVWLISLSVMFSMSIHTVAKGKPFIFFMAE